MCDYPRGVGGSKALGGLCFECLATRWNPHRADVIPVDGLPLRFELEDHSLGLVVERGEDLVGFSSAS